MNSYSTKKAYEPSELAEIQIIFDDIANRDWFSKSPEIRKRFAKYLFDTFPEGIFNARKHRLIIETSARMHYSRDDQHKYL